VRCFVFSCNSDFTTAQLEKAEGIIDENPEEALKIIEDIDTITESHGSAKAIYNLLLTQAIVKSNRELPPDSLIAFSADYFLNTGDKPRAMKSLYYLGVLTFRGGNYPRSIDVSLKSLNLAKESEETFWAALSSRNLADIFSETYGGTEQLKYARESLNDFKRANKHAFTNYALLDYARALHNNGMYSEALPVIIETVDSAEVHNDGALKLSASRLMGMAYLGLERYDKAVEYFEPICESYGANRVDSCYLGEAYSGLGRHEKAKSMLMQLGAPDDLHTWTLNFTYNKSIGNYGEAMIALEKSDSIINDVFRSLLTLTLRLTCRQYAKKTENYSYSPYLAFRHLRSHCFLGRKAQIMSITESVI